MISTTMPSFLREERPLTEGVQVSPTKGAVDAMKISLPLPFTITLIGLVVAAAAGVWRIETKIGVIETAITYERELDKDRLMRQNERDTDYRRYIDQRFETLEAKIETAGLRNSALVMSQELQKRSAAAASR